MSRSVIAQLRDIVPLRPLTRHEALSIAERQALMLRKLLDVPGATIHEFHLADLPRIEILRKSPWPVSGATQWVSGRWIIVLNGAESPRRQRFSLCHELKHVIDHPFIDVLYRGIDETERHAWIEQVCDYFAGCLLMPRPALKRAWTTGRQDLPTLAATFNVSQAAMNTRLSQTGLSEPTGRCSHGDAALKRAIANIRSSNTYYRQAPEPVPVT